MVLTNFEKTCSYNVVAGQEVKTATEINLYVDVLFCINFIMDFLVLSIVRRWLKYRFSVLRMIAGAGVGAAWAVFAAAFPFLPLWVLTPVTYVLVSSVMTALSFGLKRPAEILKSGVALCFAAAVMSGVMNVLYQHTRAGYYIEQVLMGNSREAVPWAWLLLMSGAAWFGIRFFMGLIAEMQKEKNHFYEVTMYYRGKEKKITALLDTGNRLYEPMSRNPVHVVTYEAVRDLCESVTGVVYIPFGSVGKSGVMPGIYLDGMEVRQGDQVKKIEKPLVAVCKKCLSTDNSYQMLLHED